MRDAARTARKEVLYTDRMFAPERHPSLDGGGVVRPFYSQAIRTPRFVFIGGLVGTSAGGNAIADPTIEGQTRAVLENMRAVLETAGLTFRHVVRVTVFITDRKDFQAMNGVYSAYFSEAPPARTCSTAADLYPGAKVAMSAIASCEGEGELVSSHGVAAPEDHPALAALAAGARKPFHCQGIRTPSHLFLSGVVGTEPGGSAVTDPTIEGQTRKALENMRLTLEAAGLSLRDVVSVLVLLQDRKDYVGMNRVFAAYFPDSPPARCCVTEGEHYPGSKVELVAIASFEGEKTVVFTDKAAAPEKHPALHGAGADTGRSFYSQAIRTPSHLFLSGILGTEPGSAEIGDRTIEGQTRKLMENMKAILEAGGLTLSDMVSTMVFLKDRRDFDAMNKVYAEFFPEAPPARSCATMFGLHPGARVAICGVANCEDRRGER